ncbi:murein biosynthesis integral membrane protein MurJ [Phocoenobacter skyensis]|uniref:Probable lipid II flippase MurJ n=1 Tax=Phocoenobacter skyensis TaxID=97481 RepID=A0A1H7ULL0_9PAST|nr:murein biosynthesis integral membrane protein MurJ [Pasteurella skyensis]MDP8079450.1 murein biosynthesis integral membrane protein MurJ [Pasteurella skyensis]MDP8085333.1 murein biosynthesis integral membrane protein MurJ [Pasteurella skyensis]MDP8184514.1 murein biosynthesis integral membrane protein MurJ [Pasteurella skyensis]QLB21694.1 murein biosynthesis integral membrane protein MurJ [Pasteurella skyensis]SEL97528.1 putative peptidoglycan lipid II flippase [Pasteurella skyensis]
MSKKLIKSGLIVSSMTLLSRVLGLVRDVVVANILGTGVAADVFLFANRIPNFLRRLFAEGAFSKAFVPVLAEYNSEGELDKTREFIAKVSGTLGGLVTIVTLVAMVGSPVIAALFGTGWFLDWLNGGADAEKFTQASLLLKITFPYLWFITFVALSGAVLNTLGKFGVMAFSPVLLNVAIISVALLGADYFSSPDIALAFGVFLGGLLQFLFQIPFLKKEKLLVKPKWAWKDEGVTKVRNLMIPALFGVSVTQVNLLLNQVIASFLVTGSISWLYYSDRLIEFPLGLFGIAISTVVLPSLSAIAKKKGIDEEQRKKEFNQTMDWGVRMVLLLGIPAMVGIALLAQPLLMTIFMRGKFQLSDVIASSHSLTVMCFGLISYMMISILANGFYANQDTKTPVKIGMIAAGSNICFGLLAIPFSYVGLAMASALSALVNASLLYRFLFKKGIYKISKKTFIFTVKLLIATLLMGGVVNYFSPNLQEWYSLTLLGRIHWLSWLILLAAFTYFGCLALLGLRKKDFRAE